MDFNTQRKIVKSLETKGRNPLLFIPCFIAKYAVILFMSVCRGIDMALSDRDGNFLGIKREKKQPKRYARRMARLEKEPRAKKEKRVPHRPFALRAMAFVMSFAFAFMIMPEMSVSAATAGIPFTVPAAAVVDTDIFGATSKADISELDFTANYNALSGQDLNIRPGVFSNMPLLTTIRLGYDPDTKIGANNFVSIAPDATIYLDTSAPAEVAFMKSLLSSAKAVNIVDSTTDLYSQIPGDVGAIKAYPGAGNVTLSWTPVSGADGYVIYKWDGAKYTKLRTVTTREVHNADPIYLGCKYTINSTSSSPEAYAVRAYSTNSNGTSIYSKLFCNSNSVKAVKPGAPSLITQMNNSEITYTVSMPSTADMPSYVIVYAKDGGANYGIVEKIPASAFINRSYTNTDPSAFSGAVRTYYAAAYYNPAGRSDAAVFTPSDETRDEYMIRFSAPQQIAQAQLNPPWNLEYHYVNDVWNLTWEAPLNSSEYAGQIEYVVTVNNVTIAPPTTQTSFTIPNNHPNIELGKNIIFGVRAQISGSTSINPSIEVTKIATVQTNMVNFTKLSACDGFALIEVQDTGSPYDRYTLHYSSGTSLPTQKIFTAADCTINGKLLTYKLEGLKNGTTYSMYITSNNSAYPYASVTKECTPSVLPPPATVTVQIRSDGARVEWTAVNNPLTGKPVAGYTVTITKDGGQPVFGPRKVGGQLYYEVNGLTNGERYVAHVGSYENDPYEQSATETSSAVFSPQIVIPTPTHVMATADNENMVINVTWLPVNGATEYVVYRTDSSGSMSIYKMGTATAFVDNTVRNGVRYSYVVEVVSGTPPGAMSEPASAMLDATVAPASNVKTVGIEKGIRITWDKSENAEGYYVECISDTDSTWSRVGDTTKNQFTHLGLEDGKTYRYRIVPYRIINGNPVFDVLSAQVVPGRAGVHLNAPTDFTATRKGNDIELKWTKVAGAVGYEVYVEGPDGTYHLLDRVSKTTVLHTNVPDNMVITYRVCAYKYIDGEIVSGDFSVAKSVDVGDVNLPAPTDVTATGGERAIDIRWKAVKGADGYVVYCFDGYTFRYTPVGIVTTTQFVHTGLRPNTTYRYMVAAYQNVSANPHYSKYSLEAYATTLPETPGTVPDNGIIGGTGTGEIVDYRIFITGTTPYGMSNNRYISASAERGAFNTDIDVRFSHSQATVDAVKNVLNYYGNGIDSFLVYPMDINIYVAGTDTPAYIYPGFNLTMNIPVPDMLLPYSDYISVVHVSNGDQLEVLPSNHLDVGGIDTIQFPTNVFGSFAFVIYIPDISEDTSADAFSSAQGTVEYETTPQNNLMCTELPEFIRQRRKNKIYRIVKR